MADESDDQIEGPPMICATRVLRPGGHRIGKIGSAITLPRTVPLVTAVLVGIGAVFGIVIAILAGAGSATLGVGAAIGGGIGYALATFSPLRGESMIRWIMLQITGAAKKRKIDGKPVMLAVGTAIAGRVPAGTIRIRHSAVRVRPGSVDERGVKIVEVKTKKEIRKQQKQQRKTAKTQKVTSKKAGKEKETSKRKSKQ